VIKKSLRPWGKEYVGSGSGRGKEGLGLLGWGGSGQGGLVGGSTNEARHTVPTDVD
jgi:hypothetical protein